MRRADGRPHGAGRGRPVRAPERLPQRISCQPRPTRSLPTQRLRGARGGVAPPAPAPPSPLTYLSRGQEEGMGGKGQLAPLLAGCRAQTPSTQGPP